MRRAQASGNEFIAEVTFHFEQRAKRTERERARKAARVLALAHVALARDFPRYPLSIARRLQISPAHYKIG